MPLMFEVNVEYMKMNKMNKTNKTNKTKKQTTTHPTKKFVVKKVSHSTSPPPPNKYEEEMNENKVDIKQFCNMYNKLHELWELQGEEYINESVISGNIGNVTRLTNCLLYEMTNPMNEELSIETKKVNLVEGLKSNYAKVRSSMVNHPRFPEDPKMTTNTFWIYNSNQKENLPSSQHDLERLYEFVDVVLIEQSCKNGEHHQYSGIETYLRKYINICVCYFVYILKKYDLTNHYQNQYQYQYQNQNQYQYRTQRTIFNKI